MEDFQEDRRKFIKFTWAQERLPATDIPSSTDRDSAFLRMLKSRGMKDGQNPDDAFPRADTCFFNLELPAYSSEEVMREKLSTVINLNSGMDGDDVEVDDGFRSAQCEEDDDDDGNPMYM